MLDELRDISDRNMWVLYQSRIMLSFPIDLGGRGLCHAKNLRNLLVQSSNQTIISGELLGESDEDGM